MTSSSKAKGTAWETALVKYMRELGLDTERLRQTGVNDEGDLALRVPILGESVLQDRYIIEAKNTARTNLAGWIAEAELEAANYGKHRGVRTPGFVVAYKRRNHGTGKSYVITTLDEWLRQIS